MTDPLLNPRQKYLKDVDSGEFKPDEAQAAAVEELQRVWAALVARYLASQSRHPRTAGPDGCAVESRRAPGPPRGAGHIP